MKLNYELCGADHILRPLTRVVFFKNLSKHFASLCTKIIDNLRKDYQLSCQWFIQKAQIKITISLVLIKVSLKMRHHWIQNTVFYWALPFVLVFRAIYEVLGASRKNNLEFSISPKFCFNLYVRYFGICTLKS